MQFNLTEKRQHFMDIYYYDYYGTMDPAMAWFVYLLGIVFSLLIVISLWKIFQKAGEAGWKSIIPIYNLYIEYKITWGTGWLFLLMFVPVVGAIMYVMTAYRLAKVFGKGILFALGLILFPYLFQLILGFGNARYQGVRA